MKKALYFTIIMIACTVLLCMGVAATHQTGARPHVEIASLETLENYKDCRNLFIGGTETLLQITKEANAAGIHTIVLSQSNGTKENVGYLQEHLFEVWVEEAGPQHAMEPYYTILSGADGIITNRPEAVQKTLDEICSWTNSGTLLLCTPLIIGYGGLPTIEPMDSLEGLNTAIAKRVPVTEVGVFFTKDGVPMAAHQDNLLELTGYDVNISELTEYEVTAYRITAGNTTKHQQCLVTRFKDFLSAIRGTDQILYAALGTEDEQLISFCYELVNDLELESQVIFIPLENRHSTVIAGQGSGPMQVTGDTRAKILAGEQLIFSENAQEFTDFVHKLTPNTTELSINTKAVLSTQAQATLSMVSGDTAAGKIVIRILKGEDCVKLSEDGTKISGVKYGTAVILYQYTGIIPGTEETYTMYSQPFTVNINSNTGERILFFGGMIVGAAILIAVIVIIIKRPRPPKFKPVPMSKD